MLPWLGTQLNKALRPFGVQLSRSPSGADWRRQRLMQARNIGCVIDIGANAGQYGQRLRHLGYGGWIYSYEPLPEAYRRLVAHCRGDPRWRSFELAVGDEAGSVTLNIAGNSESSSVLEMAPRHVDAEPRSRTISSVEVRSTTLDAVMEEIPTGANLLKIDTQGYEDRVLAGGHRALQKVSMLEIELSLFEVYRGQALFRDMDARIVAAGFELVSLAEGFFDRRTGELLQVDAVYARRCA
jgi:FkbM family methyltransferase